MILPDVPCAVKRKVMQVAVGKYKTKFSGQFPVFDGEKSLYCHKKIKDVKVTLVHTESRLLSCSFFVWTQPAELPR